MTLQELTAHLRAAEIENAAGSSYWVQSVL